METELFELADELKKAKDRKKKLEDDTKANNALIEELDRQLSDAMAAQELEKFSRNGSTFYLKTSLYASAPADRKTELFQALRQNGYGSLVVETVNARTLSSFVKEQKEANEDKIPQWLADVVSTYEKTTVGVRKGNK